MSCHFHCLSPHSLYQDGDSAVIIATAEYESDTLRVLVGAGSDLNLQNKVRYTVIGDTPPHIIPVVTIRRVLLHL